MSSSNELVTTVSSLGLTEVYASPDPQVDIVFVHGLNGNAYNTWTSDNNVFWPRDLLPTHIGGVGCRVLTYGYDANVSVFKDGAGKDHIHHHAENLVARLYTNRSVTQPGPPTNSGSTQNANVTQSNNARQRPLIFIVHSLGGLVVKRALIYSRSIDSPATEHLRSIFVSTYGILFLGTPHLGSDLAKWGSLLQTIASATMPKKYFDSSPHLVDALKTNNETIQNINRLFMDMMPRLRIFFFYEGKPMDLKGTRQFVVEEDSAAPNYPGVERMGIERDHSHMCKFESANSTGFNELAEAVQRYATGATEVIAVRWEQERQVRTFIREMQARELMPGPLRSSRGTSPDSRQAESHTASTPLLTDSRPDMAATWVIEEHDDAVTRQPSIVVPPRSLDQSTRLSSPTRSPVQSSASASVLRLARSDAPMATPLGFRPNTHFIGFDIEMARIVKKLADPKRAILGARSILLYGPPGCGKTHLARQYLWEHVDEYPNGLFWIDCKTSEAISKCYWNVAQSLGCYKESKDDRTDAFIDSVREHLQKRDKWLMVFDGLTFKNEQELEEFKRFVPDRQGSSIIFTTRDSTLAGRQRLLHPPGIKVYPLGMEQACSLLYKSLHIKENKKPSLAQEAKAKQLVTYYDFLPLAIHAAAHALLATGRSLERFQIGPSNQRLSTPFLSITEALCITGRAEAVNLLLLMCFLHHEVPVAMLQFGYRALLEAGIEIRSKEQENFPRREIDLSIATLIKSGLIERRLQTYGASSSGGRSSPEETRSLIDRTNSVPQHSSQDLDETNSESSPSYVGIDIVRVHTVVQQVYLDHLKSTSTAEYNQWLLAVTRFIIGAWNTSYHRIKSQTGRGSVADYREFESHTEKLWSNYPTRPDGVSSQLRKARHDLHTLRRTIKTEIDNQSPSQSLSSADRWRNRSVFEWSGSSSDEGPATPTSGLTRKSTWSNEPIAPSSESPVEQMNPAFANLELSMVDSWYEADPGYISDTERSPRKERTASTSTEKASGERQAALRAIFEGHGKPIDDIYRPIPVTGPVSVTQIEPVHSRSNSNSSQFPVRPPSSGSLAEAALSAVTRMSPSGSKEGYRVSPQRKPLAELSSNSQISHSSEPILTRLSSTSPHLKKAVLASTARRDPLPIEENITVTRRTKPVSITGRPFIPTLETLQSHSMPVGFGLERAPAMQRDLSHESTTSIQTEPAEQYNRGSGDGFLTPVMSPVVEMRRPSRERRLPSLHTAGNDGPPYPNIDSPETTPMPILVPKSPGTQGLGIITPQYDEEAVD